MLVVSEDAVSTGVDERLCETDFERPGLCCVLFSPVDRHEDKIRDLIGCPDGFGHGLCRVAIGHARPVLGGEPRPRLGVNAAATQDRDRPTVPLNEHRFIGLGSVDTRTHRVDPDTLQVPAGVEHRIEPVVHGMVVGQIRDIYAGGRHRRKCLRVAAERPRLVPRRAQIRRRALQIDHRQIVLIEDVIEAGPRILIALRRKRPDERRIEIHIPGPTDHKTLLLIGHRNGRCRRRGLGDRHGGGRRWRDNDRRGRGNGGDRSEL